MNEQSNTLKPGKYSIFVLSDDQTWEQPTYRITKPMTEHEFRMAAEAECGGFTSYGLDEDDECDEEYVRSFEELPTFDQFDAEEYDVDAMRIDNANGNFDPDSDDAEAYRHENIVRASLVNGQFAQARQQCGSYGLNYGVERFKFDGNPGD